MNKGLFVGLIVLLAAILVAAAQYGIITVDPIGQASLTGAVGVLFLVVRGVLARVTKAGWGWKTITSGLAIVVVSGAEALGFKLPSIVISALTAWAGYGLGDVVGLMKPVPKT